MRLRHLTPLLLLAPFTATAPGCVISIDGDLDEAQARREDRFAADGPVRTVVVRTRNGRVAVRPGDRLEGTATFSAWGGDLDAASERLAGILLAFEESEEGRFLLEARPQDGRSWNRRAASFELRVPPTVEVLEVESGNGSISVEVGGRPAVRLDTSNGEIELRGLPASFDLHTSNGRVRVQLEGDWRGRGRIRTSNGSVRLACAGLLASTVSARTSNGRVEVEGDAPVRLLGRDPEDDRDHVSIRTSNGSITIVQEANAR